ncbi:hypothetical protein SZ54_2823 [Rhizobium sp. UR51a]|nr:hypothetical protein SZ54_2823 [Rhizobium sp. UR51a]
MAATFRVKPGPYRTRLTGQLANFLFGFEGGNFGGMKTSCCFIKENIFFHDAFLRREGGLLRAK